MRNSPGHPKASKIQTAEPSQEEVLWLVCGGLVLALVALASRIAAVW